MAFPYAILDIGYTTTKCYLVHDSMVISNHTSYIGGRLIDSFISKTYNIPYEEVDSYKKKHCFFLTENQFHKVERPQKEFAYLMKQIIWPLIKDIKRWELGYRTKYGKKIEKYFLIGGTSNIKNISYFFSQALEAEVGHLSITEHYTKLPIKISGDASGYSLVTIMTLLERARMLPLNMLHGKFSTSSMNELPLYSTAFIALRVGIVGLFLCILLIIERVFFLF